MTPVPAPGGIATARSAQARCQACSPWQIRAQGDGMAALVAAQAARHQAETGHEVTVDLDPPGLWDDTPG